jgi:ureidoglycolate dehydrogenase (NAD+)
MVSAGKLRQARRAGTPLPPDAALDAEGRATTDPAAAAVLLPVGGAKGAGLSLMIELLTGVLAGHSVLSAHLAGGSRRHAQNAFVLALDVAAFRPLQAYREDVGGLAAILRALPRREGADEIRTPGERGERTAAEQRGAAGVRVSPKTLQELAAVAARFGLAPLTPRP